VFRSCCVLLALLCLPAVSRAQATTDVQQWTLLLATIRPTPDWRVHLELQPRLGDDVSAVDQVLTRWGVGRQISPRLSIWGGHAWIANVRSSGNIHEQRLWQQASVVLPPAGAWTPSLRFRLEQRFVDQWADSSHRVRALGRLVRPLDDEGRWSLAVWDELFVTLDDTRAGPPRGVDRNRLFGGVRRRLAAQAGLEAGYLWQAARPRVGPRQDAHAAFVWLDLVF
jgi:hypothetical protein